VRRVLVALAITAALRADAGTVKSLVVCLDGLRADAVGPGDTPAVERLADGHWQPGIRAFFAPHAHVIPDAPSVSGPNHAAILTGVTAVQHGVHSNATAALANVAQLDYLAILETRNPALSTAKLAAWAPDERIPTGADATTIAPDDTLVDRAATLLAGDVDALFLFLDGPDAAGHAEGFGGTAYLAAVAQADRAIDRLLDVIAARPSFATEDWQIVVTTDHGGLGRDHGGTSDDETTIPFLVASPHADPAASRDGVRNVDVTPTVLAHFGIDPTVELTTRARRPYRLDGVARVPVTPR
jgi:predicted AlkP superfamily pyrophosphatase or phosphodiesterase